MHGSVQRNIRKEAKFIQLWLDLKRGRVTSILAVIGYFFKLGLERRETAPTL